MYGSNGSSCSLPMAPPGAVIINGHPGGEPEHHSVCLKWTPNRLMNGGTVEDKSASWQHAVAVDMKDIIFMHCHQVQPTKPQSVVALKNRNRHEILIIHNHNNTITKQSDQSNRSK